jgi:polyisoprenoid-binding protein YceI
MRTLPPGAFLLAVVAAPAPGPANAGEWISRAGSTLAFETSYDGEAFTGRFGDFSARVDFDPASPGTCRLAVRVALASADTGHDERDEVLVGEDFFAAATAADALWNGQSCRALPDGRFVAEGTLSLRGAKKAVPLTFRWTAGKTPRLDGEARVSRLAFGVGGGDDWADVDVLPDTVKVTTRVLFDPVPPQPTNARTDAASNGQSSSAPESSRRSTGMRSP